MRYEELTSEQRKVMSQMLESSLAWMTNNDLTWSYEEKADRLEVRE